ncbi:MAG: sugar phosphate isomerase/epimerase [Ruminococcaceae bacterium]|nr:sugar phosphate isomerase/epimerase [Oscillospiraceae bacterium]
MKIGVSSYSFGKYIRETGCDYFKVCDIAKEIGFDGIEFTGLEGYTTRTDLIELAGEIKEYCAKIGLEIAAYTVGANFLAEDIEAEVAKVCKCVDIAAALGAPVMRHDVCYALPKKHLYSYRDAIKDMAPYIRRVTEYAKEKGIKTCTENHGYIFQKPERVEELILAVGSDNYGWLCDMGNFLCADTDPVLAVGIAAPYTFHVHAKDFLFKAGNVDCPSGFFTTLCGNHIRGTVVGHGIVPVKNCLAALKRVGYDGYVSIEFEGMEDCVPAIRAGFDYLKKNI